MNAVQVRNLSKRYPAGQSQWKRFRHALAGSRLSTGEEIHALSDVSFDVRRGEAFGIVGENGSGKSTLLQIIAGILQPSGGSFEVTGRLSALLELGSGFSPEFTGRENVYLNGSILGLSHEDIDARLPVIEEFAAIGNFIDQPIRTYSSGMVLRLAFAVVAHTSPDILIVDEALAVGDIAFRQRCMRRIHELRAQGATILFVSHESGDVKALCERCLWLEKGIMRSIGEADQVIAEYLAATVQRERVKDAAAPHESRRGAMPRHSPVAARAIQGRHRYGNGAARLLGAELDLDNPGDPVILRITWEVLEPIANPIAGFLVRDEKGETIFGSNSAIENFPIAEAVPGEIQTLEFHWTMPELAAGRYFISVAISDGAISDFGVCDYVEDALNFESKRTDIEGYLRIPCRGISIERA